mmetsp:Transcript_58741/g.174605  ORF Transcript_58741/g.174605 Transcript_58741/m.174605 type:complete len:254 (-) Transcript_58741:82-843(-)
MRCRSCCRATRRRRARRATSSWWRRTTRRSSTLRSCARSRRTSSCSTASSWRRLASSSRHASAPTRRSCETRSSGSSTASTSPGTSRSAMCSSTCREATPSEHPACGLRIEPSMWWARARATRAHDESMTSARHEARVPRANDARARMALWGAHRTGACAAVRRMGHGAIWSRVRQSGAEADERTPKAVMFMCSWYTHSGHCHCSLRVSRPRRPTAVHGFYVGQSLRNALRRLQAAASWWGLGDCVSMLSNGA